MDKMIKLFTVLIVALIAISCANRMANKPDTSPDSVPENAGTILNFEEKSATEPTTRVRMIITKKYLRIDEGQGSENFVLFDRQKGFIYNVVAEDQSIMVMKDKTDNRPKEKIDWQIETQTSNALMRSDPQNKSSAKHHKLKLNNESCYDLVTLNTVLKDETQALKEYYSVLADELKTTYTASEETLCFDAINILDPEKRYSLGFPYREWSTYGFQRFLLNYQERVIFPESLFKLPENYQYY